MREQKTAAFLFALNELVEVLQGLETEGQKLALDVESLRIAATMIKLAHDKIEESDVGAAYREQLC